MVTNANKMLNILKEIEPKTYKFDDFYEFDDFDFGKINGFYRVDIEYNGIIFSGRAIVHPEDKEYESELVGFTIAHMRAIRNALIYYRDLAHINYIILNKMLCDILQNQDPEVVDPTFKFRKKVYRTKHQLENYQKAIKITNKMINKYLEDQNKAIESIKKQRNCKQ